MSHVLNRFIAQKSNQFSFAHYDHTVIRYMEDSPYDTDPAKIAPQTECFFFFTKTDHSFELHSLNKTFDHVIEHALKNIKAYESHFSCFDSFQLTFNLITPKNAILTHTKSC